MSRVPLLAAVALPFVVACSSTPAPLAPFPHGEAIQLFDGPVHLGDGRANGQDFIQAAQAARLCSLVNMPRASDVYVQVRDVRHTETLSNALAVNGVAFRLPITMERDPRDLTGNGMTVSPIERIRLEQGPSEICLVAGQKLNGDVDDFEVAGVTMFVEGTDPRDIGVRRGLQMGAAEARGPSEEWGRMQRQAVTPTVYSPPVAATACWNGWQYIPCRNNYR